MFTASVNTRLGLNDSQCTDCVCQQACGTMRVKMSTGLDCERYPVRRLCQLSTGLRDSECPPLLLSTDGDGKCTHSRSCYASFLRCIIFPDSTELYCSKYISFLFHLPFGGLKYLIFTMKMSRPTVQGPRACIFYLL